jgi:tetratricopeptide (TPR) repeat protein
LRRLQQGSQLARIVLARRLDYSRSQLYDILDGRISRPPDWDKFVAPLVRACTDNDERALAHWRRRHGLLVDVYNELRRQARRRDANIQHVDGTSITPAQLPGDVATFTGRIEELEVLDHVLPTTRRQASAIGAKSTAVVISAVSGTAGVGKTALAIRWAHRTRRQFPDGQLYVNLRGYDPDRPLTAGDALAGFLTALGMPWQNIPLDVDQRAAAYRSLLDGRRILVVLDNAATVEQVRPLLPGTPSCLVIVTSRDSLAGLVARHGARRLDLDLLPSDDALALLQALIGSRVKTEPDEAAKLVTQCARLPLALRVAAELAVTRPTTSLAELVAELADEQQRLDLMDAGGDPRTAVRAVFSWSYQYLAADTARTFRLIGLHPGPDIDMYAVAALANSSLDQARHHLDVLAGAHLVQTASGRHAMHDLLRAYAAYLATAADSEQERRDALTRLFDHYLATVSAAMDVLAPAEHHRRPRIPQAVTPMPLVSDPAVALAWLDSERANLTATCAYTSSRGWPSHTTRLANTLFRYLETACHFPDALTIHDHALQAARRTSDTAGEAEALTNLGYIHWRQDRYEQAAEHHKASLTLFRKIRHSAGEARVLANLGGVYFWQGDYETAADDFQQALALSYNISDRYGEAHALDRLGAVYRRQGRYQLAIEHHQQALVIFHEIRTSIGEAHALDNLGAVYRRQGRYNHAAQRHHQALNFFRETGDRIGKAHALDNLGMVHFWQGDYERATEYYHQALKLFREIGDRGGEADAMTNLGTVDVRQGRHDDAARYHQQALSLFREIGERAGEAQVLHNLGVLNFTLGYYRQASNYYHQALTLFREIGDRGGEVKVLNHLGETLHSRCRPVQARTQHDAALLLASGIGDQYEEASAHNGLGHSYSSTGDITMAVHHWSRALALFTSLDVPASHDVHAHLETLDQASDYDGK